MKTYIITYQDGGVITAKGFDILQALTSVDRIDLVKEIKEVTI